MPSRLADGVLVMAVVVTLFAMGLAKAREPLSVFLGLSAGLGSAAFWALSSVVGPRWNARFNLFAALLAAGSLGLLAPVDRLCDWRRVPLVCR